jgi:hypothetical protein
MTKTRKAEIQKILDLITGAVEGQLSALPPEVAETKRKKIHQIASSFSQSVLGKSSKRARTRANRLSARSRAKSS